MKLAAMVDMGAHVIQQYETLLATIERDQAQFNELDGALQADRASVEEKKNLLRGPRPLFQSAAVSDRFPRRWITTLQESVARIQERFRDHCARLGIAGDVRLDTSRSMAEYAIEILVRFRDGEDFSVLNPQRQSGGERAVSTMLYLLALQDLNRCPIRVVDEINQGMDPNNEKNVFQLMLNASRGDDVPQTFLLTPKLLPGLIPQDTDNLTVLIVFNGPDMLTSQVWNSTIERMIQQDR